MSTTSAWVTGEPPADDATSLGALRDALLADGARSVRGWDRVTHLEGGRAGLAAAVGSLAQPAPDGPRLLDLWTDDGGRSWALLGHGAGFLLHTGDTSTAQQAMAHLNPAVYWLEREMMAAASLRHGDAGEEALDAVVLEPLTETQGRGVFTVPFGPVRSGVVESMLYDIATAGEDMLAVVPRTGFKRRGLELRLCEVPVAAVGVVGERIAGVFSVAGALAVCQAVENAAGVEVSAEAQAIRGILAELERVHNHCDSIMKLCDDASLAVGTAQMGILKERVLRLLAGLTGHRYGRAVVVPGGVSRGLGPHPDLGEALRGLARDSVRVHSLLLDTGSFLDRLERTGALTTSDAAALGASGPVARGSHLPWDARVERPYGPYRGWPVTASVMSGGDVMARFEVRVAELRASLQWILDLVGEVNVEVAPQPSPVPVAAGALGLGWVEAPEGEWIVVVEGGVDGRLAQARVRPASLLNFGCFRRACEGWVLTDFAFIEHSFGLSVAGCDR